MDNRGSAITWAMMAFLLITSLILFAIYLTGMHLQFEYRVVRAVKSDIYFHSHNHQVRDVLREHRGKADWPLLVQNTYDGKILETSIVPFGMFWHYRTRFTNWPNTKLEEGLMANRNASAIPDSATFIHMSGKLPVVVSRDARFYGDMFLNTKGARPGNLQGMPYAHRIPVLGNRFFLDADVRLNTDFFEQTRTYWKNRLREQASSGKNSPVRLYVDDMLRLDHRSPLPDFSVIYCSDTLYIGAGIISTNALFISETAIVIAEGKHQSQFIAPYIVARSDGLAMPSFLVSLSDKKGNITFSGTLHGGLIQHIASGEKDIANKITLSSNAEIKGLVYAANYVETSGTLRAKFYYATSYFYQSPTHHYNWLRDGAFYPSDVAVYYPPEQETLNQPQRIYYNRVRPGL
jgi:hypothetical protein